MDHLLNDFKKVTDNDNKHQSVQIILRISQLFDEELSEVKYGPYIAKVLNTEDGLLSYPTKRYLDNTYFHKKQLLATVRIFQLCSSLIKNVQNAVKSHIVKMMEVALACFAISNSSKVREAALNLITDIISNKSYKSINEGIVVSIYKQLKTFKGNLFSSDAVSKSFGILIGTFCKYYSSKFIKFQEEIRELLLTKLRNSVKGFSNSYVKRNTGSDPIPGYLDGLNSYLKAFCNGEEVGTAEKRHLTLMIYKIIKDICTIDSGKKGSSSYRSAVILLTSNDELFGSSMATDHTFWNSHFHDFLNRDRKTAFSALSTFYKAITINLQSNHSNPSQIEIYNTYFNYFKNILEKNSPHPTELRIAVVGFGYFSKLCLVYKSEQDLVKMFRLIIQKLDFYYLSPAYGQNTEQMLDKDNVAHILVYIKALSKIIVVLKNVGDDEFGVLEQMNILMIKALPNLPKYYHQFATSAFMDSVKILNENESIMLDKFLHSIIYQGIIWSCSLQENNIKLQSYKDFILFWKNLLEPSEFPQNDYLQKIIFGNIVEALFLIISKLDLHTKCRENETEEDSESYEITKIESLRASNIKDFHIFLNIVDFYCEIIESMDAQLFQNFISLYLMKLVNLSVEYPLISGFYKLISAGIFIIRKLSIDFKTLECYTTFNMFLYEVLNKFQHYKDDLQMSMIELVLSCPKNIMDQPVISSLANVMQVAFDIGLIHHKISIKAIGTLESWCLELTPEEKMILLKPVLPKFNKFLKIGYKTDADDELLLPTAKTIKKKKLTNKRIVLKMDPELMQLQGKIMEFMGNLDPEYRYLIIQNSDSNSTKFDKVKYELNFEHCKSFLQLEQVLPRIVELALTCSDRKLRIRACETLHTIIVYLIGKSSGVVESLYSTCIILGCDPDPAVSKLFDTLIKQIIHWITSPTFRIDNTEFIQIVTDSLVDPSNLQVQRYAADCLREFTSWNFRQQRQVKGRIDLQNIQKLLDTIVRFSMNPDPNKRYGSAVAFNRLFDILAPEVEIVNIFWLELMYSTLKSLNFESTNDTEFWNGRDLVFTNLNKILKIMLQKYSLFNEPKSIRRKPHPFQGVTLKEICLWLLEQSVGYFNIDYVKQCQYFLTKLTTRINDTSINSPSKFIKYYRETTNTENCITVISSMKNYPLPVDDEFDQVKLLPWLKQFHVGINTYLWVLTNKYIPTDLISQDLNQILDILVYFIPEITDKRIENNRSDYSLIKTIKLIKRLRSDITVDMLELINILISDYKNPKLDFVLSSNQFMKFIVQMIFEPELITTKVLNQDAFQKRLTTQLIQLLNLLHSSNHVVEVFIEMLNQRVQTIKISETLIEVQKSSLIPLKNFNHIKGMLLLSKVNFWNEMLISHNYVYQLEECLVEKKDNILRSIALSPSVSDYFNLVLQLSLLSVEDDQLITILNNSTELLLTNVKQQTYFGIYFLTIFESSLWHRLVTIEPDRIAIINNNLSYTFQLTWSLISMVKKFTSPRVFQSYSMKLVTHYNQHWDIISSLTENDSFLWLKFIGLFKHLLHNGSNVVGFFKQEEFRNCANKLLEEITITGTENFNPDQFSYKIKMLDFVLCFTNEDDTNNEVLSLALNSYKTYYLVPDVKILNHIEFMSLFSKFVSLYQATVSPLIMDLILHMLSLPIVDINLNKNNCENILQEAIENLMKYMDTKRQLKVLKNFLDFLTNSENNEITVIVKVLTMLINHARTVTIKQFFEENIENFVNLEPDNLNKFTLEQNIIKLAILQYFYLHTETQRQEILQKSGCVEEDIALRKRICKFCYMVQSLECKVSVDLNHLFVCTAYNTFAAIISHTQTNFAAFHIFFMFKKWTKLFDCEKNYTFPQEFDKIPEFKKKVVCVRRMVREKQHSSSSTIDYLSSLQLFESSLANDVTKFDFCQTELKSNPNQVPSENVIDNTTISIELDEINKHPCMLTICGLVSQLTLIDVDKNKLPDWMKNLKEVLQSSKLHNNIKIFVLKVIENNKENLKPWGKWLIGDIMNAISNSVVGNEINYFMNDLILLMVEWNVKDLTYNDHVELQKFLRFLIPRCYHERSDLYKFYLEILKSVIEIYSKFIHFTARMDYFYTPKDELLRINLHIQSSAYLLKHNILFWDNEVDRNEFIKVIEKNYMESGETKVYVAATELMGMILKHLDENNQMDQNLLERVKQNVEDASDQNRYFQKLEAINKHYPAIIDAFTISHLINVSIKTVPHAVATKLLEIVNTNIASLYEMCRISNDLFFEKLLTSNDIDLLIRVLQCLKAISPKIEEFRFSKLLDLLGNLATDQYGAIRKIVYEIAVNIYYRFENDSSNPNFKWAQDILLVGMTDCIEELQEYVYNFWNKKFEGMPEFELMVALFDIYNNKTEQFFLSQYVWFLLNSTTKSREYSKKIYDAPLTENCQFTNMKLDLNFQARQASLTPLFIEASIYSHESNANERTFQILATRQLDDISLQDTSGTLSLEQTQMVSSNWNEGSYRKFNKRFKKHDDDFFRKLAEAKYNKTLEQESIRKVYKQTKDYTAKVYRKYRSGDFPDIEITHQDFIKSLQLLAKMDYSTSSLLFISILNGFIKNESIKLETRKFLEMINTQNILPNILQTSNMFDPNLVRAFFLMVLKHHPVLSIPHQVIATASQQSGLLALGALVLEQRINDDCFNDESEEPKSKRKAGSEPNIRTAYWIKLADLYKSMAESDYVYGIFHEKIENADLKIALRYELNNNWAAARETYLNMITKSKTGDSLYLTDFCYESFFNCFNELSQWDTLDSNIKQTVGSYNDVWKNEWNQTQVLPWLMKTQVYYMCHNETCFAEELQSWLKDTEKTAFLERNFSEYLTIFSIWSNKFEDAKYYTSISEKIFLNDWSNLNSKQITLQNKNLQKLEIYSDFKLFHNTYGALKQAPQSADQIIPTYCENWLRNKNFEMVENKRWYRRVFAEKIESCLNAAKNVNPAFSVNTLNEALAYITSDMLNYSLIKKNFSLAKRYSNILEQAKKELSLDLQIRSQLGRSKLYLLRYYDQIKESGNVHTLTQLLIKSWKTLIENNEFVNHSNLNIEANFHLYEIAFQAYELTKQHPELNSKFDQIFGDKNENFNVELFEKLQNITKLCLNEWRQEQTLKNTSLLSEAYLKIINFCRNMCNDKNDPNFPEYLKQLIISICKCMKLGTVKAIQMFPCLLAYNNNLSDELMQIFQNEIAEVPTWMLLNWIPQLLAAVNSTSSVVYQKCLERLADEYPNAMCYAYRVSRDKLYSKDYKDFFEKMDSIFLKDENMNTFLRALLNVNLPEVILSHHVTKLMKTLRQDDDSLVLQTYEDCQKDLFGGMKQANNVNLCGDAFQDIQSYEQQLHQLFHSDLQKTEIHTGLRRMLAELKKKSHNKMGLHDLKNYSPWLIQFEHINLKKNIELPGQYNKYSKPSPDKHNYIVRFRRRITIMSTLRKPVKITMMASNGIQYSYLIKFGEDLRQDQRIQQLFSLMNTFLESSKIATYDVVPLTHSLGIIEWVDDTVPMMELGFKTQDMRKLLGQAQDTYRTHIRKCILDQGVTDFNDSKMYSLASCYHDVNNTIAKFEELKNMLPSDVFRKGLIESSSSIEDFFYSRHEFATSYATMSIAHWLLGVGDRHLNNILISPKTGKVIGIDFGYSFGVATQILSIPELVPIRVTPQILNLLKPFQEIGILKQTMIKSLRLIKENQDILLSLMDIFAQEPTIDWLEMAQQKFGNENSVWDPERCIRIAREKLNGASSTRITVEELKLNPNVEDKTGYIRCIEMVGECEKRDLSVEDQVDCLLKHAMERNVLGRMYCNWNPFV